jgi:hypothetical protein
MTPEEQLAHVRGCIEGPPHAPWIPGGRFLEDPILCEILLGEGAALVAERAASLRRGREQRRRERP